MPLSARLGALLSSTHSEMQPESENNPFFHSPASKSHSLNAVSSLHFSADLQQASSQNSSFGYLHALYIFETAAAVNSLFSLDLFISSSEQLAANRTVTNAEMKKIILGINLFTYFPLLNAKARI